MADAIPATMRAVALAGPRRAELREVPTPAPGPGELLIRVEGCGLCGSNVPVWEGRPWFDYPMAPGAPGHEGWGRVAALGDGVSGFAPGDRLAFLSDRALAAFDVARADQVVRIPPELDHLDVAGEPFGCAMNAARRSDFRPGQTVAVVGVGFLGAALVALAHRAGARVLALSRRPFALELARSLGADEVFQLGDDDDALTATIEARTGGAGCERVIEAAGVQRTLSLASRLVATRGTLVIVGFHQDGPRQVDVQGWNWRGIDVVNAHERDPAVYVEGMAAAVDAIGEGTLDPARLVTHRFPFERAGDAFEALVERPDGFLKAVVTP